MQVGVRPGVARARIGSVNVAALNDFKAAPIVQAASLVNVAALVTVTGSADVEAADQSFKPVTFRESHIAGQIPQTVKTTGLTSGAVSSLLGRLKLDVKVIGLGLGLGNLTQSLNSLLAPIGRVLDGSVNGVLDTLGLSFGEADVTVHGATCPRNGSAVYLVG